MTEIILSLFNPNTLLPHRAGMAGLALALSVLSPVDAPLDWEVTDDEVRLFWEECDREAIAWLVGSTYQIEDGYLNIPALKLDLQGRYTFTQGILSTFLQHGKQRSFLEDSSRSQEGKKKFYLEKTIALQIEPSSPEIVENHTLLQSCYYTNEFKDAFTPQGQFKTEIALKGHHLPGLVRCYINGTYQESPSGFVALLFLPLACGYYKLPGSSLRSALVIPEVTNLKQWVRRRQQLPGLTYKQFRASGAGESGLRFLLQEKAISDTKAFKVEYCEVYQLGKQIWDANQPYLKQAVYRIHATDKILALYEDAAHLFPARVKTTDKGETWLATSKVLPWIADNLIANKPWYLGFYAFRKANQLYAKERKGLLKMTQHLGQEERILFEAVQGAFSAFLRQQILHAKKQGRPLDYAQVTDKAIYRLQRPSTKQQFSSALVDFLSHFRSSAAAGKGLEIVGWIHSDENWRKARDLALLAIATYKSKNKAESDNSEAKSDNPETKSDNPETKSDNPETKSGHPEAKSDNPEANSDSAVETESEGFE